MEMIDEIRDLVLRSETILDIGSRDGENALLYSHINSRANIYCFEPDDKFFLLLEKNVFNSGVKNITIFKNAIGSKKKIIRLDSDEDDIEMITIDSLNLLACNFIIIKDAGGSAKSVLSGAIKTITRYKPAILYQDHELDNVLYKIGYELVEKGNYRLAISSSA